MTTGPRETPHPIILHVDDQGNPVRLAEASSIYVTTVSAVSISATNWFGLNLDSPGIPVGQSTEIQFRKNGTEFDGDTSLTFDKANLRLRATEIVVSDLSSTNKIFSEETITALEGFSGASLSSTSARIGNLSATIVSAVTVCAINYNSLFDSLSFQNLDARYLNSSGDSVTGSFFVQSLSSTSISATNYLNIPSTSAIWNANSIQGIPVTSTPPGLGETLVYKDGIWQPSSITGGGGGSPGGSPLSIQFKNGSFLSGLDFTKYNESISGIQSVGLSSTNLSSVNIRVTTISATTYQNNGSGLAVWNAQKIQDVPVSKPGSPTHKDILAINSGGTTFEKAGITDYANWVYTEVKQTIHAELPQTNASAIRGVQVTSTAPISNQILMYSGTAWIPTSSTLNFGTVNSTNNTASILTALTGTITTLSSTSFSSVSARITGQVTAGTVSATNLGGTNIVGTRANITNVSATTISATYYENLPAIDASSLRGVGVSLLTPSAGQALVYSSAVDAWKPGYRIFQSSSAPNNLLGLDGDIYLQYNTDTVYAQTSGLTNASALLSSTILSKELNNGSGLGFLAFNYTDNVYQPVSFNSKTVNGSRDAFDIPYQGKIIASYLGSASEYFQIDPYWNTGLLPTLPTPYPYPNLPKNNDVLIFTDDLYNKSIIPEIGQFLQTKAWTWKSLSFSGGHIQDVDTDGALINNILTYDGSKWIYSPSATLTSVSSTSSRSASSFTNTISATNYLNLPYTRASSIDIDPVIIATRPITNNSILTYVNSAWRPSFSSLVATVSSTNLSSTNSVINNLKIAKSYKTKSTIPISSSAITLDLNNSQNFELTLSSNITTLEIQNYNEDAIVEEFLLFIKYNSNTSRTIQWTQNDPAYYINWPSGTQPTLTCANNKLDIFRFITTDGFNWYGSVVGQNYTIQ